MSFSFVFPLVGGSGGGGTVSSVGLSMPTNDFNIANSPVTGSDTIAVTYKPQIQNLIFGSPDGIAGTPLFRYLVGADLPSATTSVKGALPIATDAEALTGSITDKTIVPETLSYTFLNRQIGAITAINSAILATDTINGAFAKTQGQINAKQNTLTIGNITGSEFSITGGVGAVIGTGVSLSLAASGVTANTYGSSTVVPVLTVNSKGVVTGVTNTSIAFPPSSVTSVFGRTGPVVSQSGDYTFAQIGSTPTTLAGYGITDAIASGGSGSVSDISITGLAGSGFLNLRYQSSTPVGIANYGTLYADSIGNIGYKKNANSFTNSLYFSGTADRVYTLQDRSGTLADDTDLSTKLDLDGGNANQDINIDGFSLNAKHFKVNGTAGAGHIGLKHQSASITASASESSIGADSVGDPVWKNDGGAIDKLELQSNKTSTVTGNEASTSKYLTVKGVYDWAVGLFAPKASPTFTGTVTAPDIVVSSATATTPTFFDAAKKLITTTAQLWGTWVQSWANKATPVDADTIGFYNSASTFVGVKSTLLNFWTTYLLPKIQALSYVSGSISSGYIPYFNGTSLVNSRVIHNYYTHSTAVLGSASYANAFLVTDNTETKLLLGIQNDGLGVVMNSTRHSFGAIGAGAGQIIFDRNLTYSNLITVQATNTTSTNYIQGWLNSGQTIYGFRYSNTLVALWQSNDNTASTILQKWSNSSNTQIGVLQNDGLYFGPGTKSPSALSQLDSTTQGFLPPRMTNAQMIAIASPATGLLVYQTDGIVGLYLYKNSGWSLLNSTINTKQTDLYFTSGMLTMTTAYPDAGTITKFINNNAMFATAQYSLNGGGAWTNITFTANVATVSIAMSANSNIMVRTTLAGANVDGTLTIQATL